MANARLRAGSSSRSTLGLMNRLAREDQPLTEKRRGPNRTEGRSSRARADFPPSPQLETIRAPGLRQAGRPVTQPPTEQHERNGVTAKHMTIDTRKGIAHGLDCRLVFAQLATLHGREVTTIANEVKNRMRWSNRNYGCSDAALRTRTGSRLADVIRDLGAARTKTRLAQCRESRARRTHEFARSARRSSRTFLVSFTLANSRMIIP